MFIAWAGEYAKADAQELLLQEQNEALKRYVWVWKETTPTSLWRLGNAGAAIGDPQSLFGPEGVAPVVAPVDGN